MQQAGSNWNDDRLDHLSGQVDLVRDQVNALQHHMDNRFENQDARIQARFDRLQNAMIVTLASILAAFGGAIAAIRF